MADGFTIQMGDTAKPARIGRFEENVNLREAQQPVRMWEELEAMIEEDPAKEEEKKPTDFRRNRRRHVFKRKTRMLVKDSGKKNKGQLNLQAMPDDTTNKYALLKVSTSSTGEKFLNVIPVDSWWSFKRPVISQVKTLEEVDAKVEERKQQLAKERKRYAERFRRAAEENGTKEEMYADQIYGTGNVKKSSSKSAAASDPAKLLGLGDAGEDLDEVAEWKQSFQGEGDEYLHHSNDEGDLSENDSVAEEENEKPADAYDLNVGQSSDESEEEEEEEENDGEEPLDELTAGSRQVGELMKAKQHQGGASDLPVKRPRGSEEKDGEKDTSKRPKRDELVAELNEENVRKFMMLHGAKMPSMELLQAFKSVARTKAARQQLVDIVAKLTILEEDPLLGKVRTLREQHRRW